MAERRLLAISPVAPWPVTNGYGLRVAELLAQLARQWRITLVAPGARGASPPASVARWIDVGDGDAATFLPWQYDMTPLRAATALVVREWAPHAALVWSGAEPLARVELAGVGVVADRIDCLTLTAWRQLRTTRSPRQFVRELRGLVSLARYEREMARAVDATVVVGEDDARWLRRVTGRDRVEVIANGVAVPEAVRAGKAARPTVIFSGVMAYGPNMMAADFFARAVWPAVRARHPSAEFLVAGRHPAPSILALGALPGVRVVGEVPSMVDALASAWVAVAPMRSGAGIKNKILEAWAVGTPVVMTRLAANGLSVRPPLDGLIGDAPEVLARLVGDLLADASERHRLGVASRETARQDHAWTVAGDRLDALLARARPRP